MVAICDHLQNIKFSPGLPYAFTEPGALMAANILSSERAVRMSVYVIRAFVRLRDVYEKIKPLLVPPKPIDAIGFELDLFRPGKIG